ncbi:MAG: beta-lactamase family protein, partial [Methylobacteriaceae bacterium]|nr:beta-lactamase family protein [Methylobacteriaceae bacterium]
MSLAAAVEAAFAPARAAIAQRRIPGAVLAAADLAGARSLVFDGAAQIIPTPAAMTADTIFDLASLTKVVFTTTAILRLVEQGAIGLDDPLVRAIPDLRQYDMEAAERKLTFRACLSHQTFLPHVEPIYAYGLDPQTSRAFVLQREWRQGPPVYSDINFMLLGIAIERLTGAPLEAQLLPPGFTWRPDPARSAATEACSWRGRVMR